MTKIECFWYMMKVNLNLLCPFNIRKTIIENFKQQIIEYIEQNPHSTIKDMTSFFGTPQLVAERYLSAIDSEIMDRFKSRVRIYRFVFIIIVLAILALVFFVLTHERPGKIVEGVATELTTLRR